MKELTDAELETVCGGMRWEHFRRSTNIEDRRDWSRQRSLNAPLHIPNPLPRRPRDLPATVPLPPRRPPGL